MPTQLAATTGALPGNARIVADRIKTVGLDDKYTASSGSILLPEIQALLRLPMPQRQRGLAAGVNTGGFISVYRGSPLGVLD